MRGIGITINDNMRLKVVPKRNSDGLIISGMVVGETLYQNQALILLVQPGEIKEKPTMGVGLGNGIFDEAFSSWRRKIWQKLELDGQLVKDVVVGHNENIKIDASYT